MNCRTAAVVMSEYLDDCLPGHVRLEFEIHINECRRCADELQSMQNMLTRLGSLSVNNSSVNCWPGVKQCIVERRSSRRTRSPWFMRVAIGAPAFALTILLVVLLLLPGGVKNESTAPEVSVPEYSYYISAHSHAQRQQALSDPHVSLVAAELEKASLTEDTMRP
ncbi:zf-HC2 domain-containing protein [bacterium]|nr:zf-HC2 domain-containing protein [bacterium]